MEELEIALTRLFKDIGEDPARKGLLKTPKRVVEMYRSFLTGYESSSLNLLGNTIELKADNLQETICVNSIPFCSLCEHHLVPFFGEAHLVYIPSRFTLGLGRIFKYVAAASRKLSLQENLSAELARSLQEKLQAKALLLKMKAKHTCLALSGTSPLNTELTTHNFEGDPKFKSELMSRLDVYT